MSRGLLFQEGCRVQFSGHETFPLRYGWLKKTYDEIVKTENDKESNKKVFSGDDAISRFGVGKNMVSSMRHWALSCGIIKEPENSDGCFRTERLGKFIFDEDEGVDKYLEFPSSVWLLHWKLCSTPEKTTTWYWVFNNYPGKIFDRDQIREGLEKLCETLNFKRGSSTTLKRDVDCFIRTYVPKSNSKKVLHEENLESPLAELSLIRSIGKRDGFQMMRGTKTTLLDGVFVFALINFWKSYTSAKTLTLETIGYEPGSPGRVFLLDETDLTERLSRLSEVTDGALVWSETAGLRQVIMKKELSEDALYRILEADYNFSATWSAPYVAAN